MKEFYVLNLDYRRIAILVGGMLVLLGLTLFIGMAIGRGQSERKLLVEAEAQKTQLAPELGKPASEIPDKIVAEAPSFAVPVAEKKEAVSTPPAMPTSEIPLREDPLVQGPPKRKSQPNATTERSARHSKRRQTVAKVEPELSGEINHAAKVRYTIQVAAFKRASEAQNLVAKLKEEGIKARSEKSGAFYLVTVGRSKSKEKLNKALARLKELEYDAYIRKLSKTSEDT